MTESTESNLKFSVAPETFRTQLGRCSKVASNDSKSGLRPIYGYVLLIAQHNMVTLRAHDPHVTFEGRFVPDTLDSDGEALVECDRLMNIVKTRVEGYPIDVWVDKEFLHLKQGEFRAKLPLLRKETIPEVSFKGPFKLEAQLEPKMLDGLTRCGKVIEEKADTSYAGLLLDFEVAGTFRICGFSRALVHVAQFPIANTHQFRVVLSPKVIPLLESLSRANETTIGIDTDSAKVVITSAECSLRVACIEDGYPKGYMEFFGLHKMAESQYYLTKIDKDGRVEEENQRQFIRLNKNGFLDAMTSASSVLGKEDLAIELNVSKKLAEGQVVLEMVGLNRFSKAKAQEKILANSDITTVYQLGIHYGKVREALRDFESDTFTLWVGSAQDVFFMIEEERSDFVSIGIPLKVA